MTIEGSGTCTVSLTARVDGYIDGRIDRSVTVRPGTIGLNWLGYSSDSIGFGDTITLREPAVEPSNATLVYTSSTQSVCTVDQSSGELTIRAVGICRVHLTASMDHHTNATVDRTVTVNPGTMSLNWPGYSPNSISFGDATTLNSPTATPSNATLRYNSSTHSVCTVDQSSGELTILGTGICSISLTASATNYTNIVINRTVTVGPGTMDLTWTGYSAERVDQGGSVTLSNPTVTPSTATLSYTASPSSVCTVNSSSGALTIVGVGICRVRLTASSTNYASRTVERTVIVGQDTIGLNWTGYSSNRINFGDTLTLNQPTADPSDATLRYTSNSLRICTVNSSTGAISQVDSGTCSITLTATRAGYRSESMSKSIYIARISMSSFDWDGYSNNNVGTLSSVPTLVAPTGVPTGATFEYYSSSPNVCSVNSSSGALSLVATGSCNIQVTVRAKGYNAKIDRVTVTIN